MQEIHGKTAGTSSAAAKNKKPVYRHGDKVRIVNPEFFIRCGYATDFWETLKETENNKELIEKVDNFIKESVGSIGELAEAKVRSKILAALNYGFVAKKGLGNERKIYTKVVEAYRDKIFTVYRKKVVKTGVRYHERGNDEDGYDPSYLYQEKSHVILYLSSDSFELTNFDDWNTSFDGLGIEEKNVIKL